MQPYSGTLTHLSAEPDSRCCNLWRNWSNMCSVNGFSVFDRCSSLNPGEMIFHKAIRLRYRWAYWDGKVTVRDPATCVCLSQVVNKSFTDICISHHICQLWGMTVQMKDQTRSPPSPCWYDVWISDFGWLIAFCLCNLTAATLTRWMAELGVHFVHIPQSAALILPRLTFCSQSEQPGRKSFVFWLMVVSAGFHQYKSVDTNAELRALLRTEHCATETKMKSSQNRVQNKSGVFDILPQKWHFLQIIFKVQKYLKRNSK